MLTELNKVIETWVIQLIEQKHITIDKDLVDPILAEIVEDPLGNIPSVKTSFTSKEKKLSKTLESEMTVL